MSVADDAMYHVIRKYFEDGCACLHRTKLLTKIPPEISDEVAANYYKDNCKCSRNFKGKP